MTVYVRACLELNCCLDKMSAQRIVLLHEEPLMEYKMDE
jgi:hypothetical protein